MKRLEVSGAVRPICGSLGVKRIRVVRPVAGEWNVRRKQDRRDSC